LESSWIVLALSSAFLLATADAWTKRYFNEASAASLLIIRISLSGLLLLPFWLSLPWPDLPWQFWAWILPAVPLEVVALTLYIRNLQRGRLSHTLPFMAFTPALVAITGWILLGEQLHLRGLVGVMLTVLGAWFLFVAPGEMRQPKRWLSPFRAIARDPAARGFIVVAAMYSVTAVLGRGALQYAPAIWVGSGYFVLIGFASLLTAFALREPIHIPLRTHAFPVLLIAAGMGGMALFHFLALQDVEIAYMITVKRTSLLFAMLYGAWWFREPGLKQNLFAGVMMLAGVGLVAWP